MTRAGLPAAVAGLWLAGCSSGTSLLLEIELGPVPAEQLHVAGTSGGHLVFGPAVRPERADGLLSGPQTLRVLLPDQPLDAPIVVQASALQNGQVTGRAEAEVSIRRGRQVRLPLSLLPAGPECAGCGGCCDASARCLAPSVAACGAGGVACFACDPQRADRCDGEGRCHCGQGPACSPVGGADTCVEGACLCGKGPSCPPGTGCHNGVCRCKAASCAGCCAGNECLPGTTAAACGEGAATCRVCNEGAWCEAGECTAPPP